MNVNANNSNANRLPSTPVQRLFIKRDYHLGINIRFAVDFPPELNGRIDDSAFVYTINHINEIFEEAERISCSTCWESFLGFMTANLIYTCTDTTYEKCLKRVSKFVAEQNQRVYLPRGLMISDPTDHGLRTIAISILEDGPRS